MTKPLNCALTIAGSDPGGGAGIQADLKTFAAHRVYGMSVITALTAQNTLGVYGISVPEPGFVSLQLDRVLDDFPVKAAKTGMLFSVEIISEVWNSLKDKDLLLVVDPVCISQSGHRLLREDAVEALKKMMIPKAILVTPNKPEAELLTGIKEIDSREKVLEAIDIFIKMGAKGVLLKGGHFQKQDEMVDWLGIESCAPFPIKRPRIKTRNTHGTGCTLSAAIAANLARGLEIGPAVEQARDYLQSALENSFNLGGGDGPVNHLVSPPGL
ncbi:bifunctional hydroxymethylpyrimidine kinase/phosphomethylpyrimidine kinase [Desulfonatronovibrio hydrogenovorans]|uniref:bifunctional hydroxymethylpyrimidine kinase/phosphomethylpyrimidine kinase n=1 Tax=Desulfonatronovibrio hydrogenovorans TaxID=53245 RepID=UPI00048BAE52|nr:bifunctional hydroxymethylpyrimidine kinase/phosphomethylpyrimidine kinase [Desulfonatronovibrio hydrogenovorans]